jgi:hypothetical protein
MYVRNRIHDLMQRSTKHLGLFSEEYVDLSAYNKLKTDPLKYT